MLRGTGAIVLAGALAGGVASPLAAQAARAGVPDSVVRVRTGAQESGVPIWVVVSDEASGGWLPRPAVFAMLAGAVAARAGASMEGIAGSEMPRDDRSFVRLRVRVHEYGITAQVTVSCAGPGGTARSQHQVWERTPMTHEDSALRPMLVEAVRVAARPACGPESAVSGGGYTLNADDARAGAAASGGPVAGVSIVTAPSGVGPQVDSLVVRPARVRLKVGEKRDRDSLFTLVGYKGGAAVEVVPWSRVKDGNVMKLWGGVLTGLSPGQTVLEVGQMVRKSAGDTPRMTKVLAKVVVEVVP